MLWTYRCPNGHSWTVDGDIAETVIDGVAACPECGSLAEERPPPPRRGAAEIPAIRVPAGAASAIGAGDLFGRYELRRQIGRGGMGVVYEAFDPSLGRMVALKVVRHAESAAPAERARFLREAEAAAKLAHPHIVAIYDFGEERGQPYFTMELLPGGDLKRHRAFQGQPRDVAVLMETLARAVHAAHEQGLVHRDLKPANVLLDRDGEPKLTDFGLVKRLDLQNELTETGAVLGTPAYMAPEQFDGLSRDVGPAADIYALGVIMYEALTGRRPHTAQGTLAQIRERLEEEPESPSRLRRIPRDLETICLKCLRRAPGHRYRTASDLADDLRRYLNDEPILARRAGLLLRTTKWFRRRPSRLLGAAASGSAAAAIAVSLWYWDAYVATRVSYHAGIAFRRGVPEGVGDLVGNRVRSAPRAYELTRHGRRRPPAQLRVLTPQLAEAADNPLRTWFDGIVFGTDAKVTWSRNEYVYDDTGDLSREIGYSLASDHVVYELQYRWTKPGGDGADIATVRYLRERNLDLSVGPVATVVELTHDERGFATRARFLDGRENPRMNREGVYGYRIEHDASGLVTCITGVDQFGDPMENRFGIVSVTQTYERGRPAVNELLDARGQPHDCIYGYARMADESSPDGRLQVVRYSNAAGQPALDLLTGVCEIHRHYDATALRLLETYRDTTGASTVNSQGIAEYQLQHNRHGQVVEWTARGLAGESLQIVDLRYDESGQLCELSMWADEARTQLQGRQVTVYENRLPIRELLYNGQDRLISQEHLSYDGEGRVTRIEHLDGAGNRWPGAGGYATEERSYYPSGAVQQTVRSGFEAAFGYARLIEDYSEQEELTQRSFYAEDGFTPALCGGGFHRVTIDRDAQTGSVRAAHFVDADHRPVAVQVVVAAASPRPLADLQPGDLLVAYDGLPIASSFEFLEVRGAERRGLADKPLMIVRDGEEVLLHVPPGPFGVDLEDRVAGATSEG